jgi:uncharacterized membrane protein (DUF485 family)
MSTTGPERSPAAADSDAFDWTAIEGSAEFRELTGGRRRFSAVAGALGVGTGVLYIALSAFARDFMGTQVIGSISLAFLGGILLILLTWAITFAYMRRSAREWEPLEERIRAAATPGQVSR